MEDSTEEVGELVEIEISGVSVMAVVEMEGSVEESEEILWIITTLSKIFLLLSIPPPIIKISSSANLALPNDRVGVGRRGKMGDHVMEVVLRAAATSVAVSSSVTPPATKMRSPKFHIATSYAGVDDVLKPATVVLNTTSAPVVSEDSWNVKPPVKYSMLLRANPLGFTSSGKLNWGIVIESHVSTSTTSITDVNPFSS
jgi:hypothetical protein